MAKSDDDKLRELLRSENLRREKIRLKFVAHREIGHSIVKAANAAGISSSTYYAWNSDGNVSMKGGWSKGGW